MKQDYNGVRTAQDLERKYDFTQLEKVNEINNNIIQANKNILTTNMNNEIKLFVEAVTKYMDDYSVDGNITTYYYSGIPSLNNNPALEWVTDEEKNNHIWDLYYNKETGYVYMFTLEDETYSWQRLEDYDVEKALALANAARDTKDNKRRLFLTQPTPPYDSGDMWKNGDEILICQIGKPSGETYAERDFIIDSKYVDNTVATEANGKLTVLSGSVLEIENNVNRYSRTLTETVKVVDQHGNYIGDRSTKTTTLTQDINGINLNIGVMDTTKGTLSEQTANIRADINGLRSEIGNVTDVTITKEGDGTLYFNGETESVNASNPISMLIYPTTEDITYVYPSNGTYPTTQNYPEQGGLKPSSTLTPSSSLVPATGFPAQYIKYPTSLYIDFYNQTEDEHIYYQFPKDLRILGTTYDEFQYDYENQTCKVIRRIGINSYGEKYILQTPENEDIEFPEINLTTGKYVVTFVPFSTAHMKMVLMSQNMYTSQYATKVELNGKYEFTYDHFTMELGKKVGEEEVIAKINGTAEDITIAANKVNISGVITAINGETSTTIDGNKITTGTITANQIAANTIEGNKIKANTIEGTHIKANTIDAENIKADAITTDKIATGAVTANEITTGAITTAKLATLAVTTDKIAANTITGDKISAGTITGDKLDIAGVITSINNNGTTTINGNKITTGSIDTAQIKASAITTGKIQTGAINADKIASGTITGDKIAANTINATKLNVTNLSSLSANMGTITGGLISNNRAKLDMTNGILNIFHRDGGGMILSNAVRLSATAGVAISSNSNGSVAAPAKNLDLKACSGAEAYLACMGNANGTSEKSAVDCANGALYLRSTGPIYANKQITVSSSSRATKKHIKDLKQKQKDEVYDLIKNIPLKQYDYRKGYGKPFNYGFIIEDIEDTLLKKLIHIEQLDTNKEIKNYSNEDLTRLLLIVVQELQKKNEDLEKRVEMLEKGDDK